MSERNPPSTPQALQNAHNLVLNNTPLDVRTFDEAEFNRLGKERRASIAAAEAATKQPDEDCWRQELEELDRRLRGQMTPDEAELYANNEANKYKVAVKAVETEIATLEDLLKTPGLSRCIPLREGRELMSKKYPGQLSDGCNCDVHLFRRKIEAVTLRLAPLKAKQQQSIKACGDIIRASKELVPFRKRWEELKAREKKIEIARRAVRGKQNSTPLQVEPQTNSRISSWQTTTRGGFKLEK